MKVANERIGYINRPQRTPPTCLRRFFYSPIFFVVHSDADMVPIEITIFQQISDRVDRQSMPMDSHFYADATCRSLTSCSWVLAAAAIWIW